MLGRSSSPVFGLLNVLGIHWTPISATEHGLSGCSVWSSVEVNDLSDYFPPSCSENPPPPVTDRVCAKRFSLNFHDSERVAQQTNAFPIIRGFCAAKVGWSSYKTIHCWEISKTIVTCCFLGLALQAKVRFLDDFVRVVCKALLRMTEWLMVCVCV